MLNNYEVLTENGFKDFLTVSSKTISGYLRVVFDDDTVVECTAGHEFKTSDGFKRVADMIPSDRVSPNGIRVASFEHIDGEVEVFDLVEVSDGNHYLTNGVTSHNCDFLSSDGGLMDSYVMGNIQKEVEEMKPVFTIEDQGDVLEFFAKINPLSTYLLGVDPATGSGLDYSSIQIFEFPSMIQVCEWRSNVMAPVLLYTMMKKLVTFLASTGATVYFSAENNGVGQSIIALYMADTTPPRGTFVSEEGKTKLGIVTSPKSKIRTCVKMKNMIERRAITLTSKTLVTELKSYVRKAGSYSAQIGSTDDSIAALLIVIRILEEIANFDQLAYHMMYEFEAPETWDTTEGHLSYPESGYSIPVLGLGE